MLKIFLTFIYTGFLAFGGGLATIPILYQLMVLPGEILEEDFYNMIAISQATPGPVGLNIATYVGYNRAGSIGAILTSIGISISSIICVSILARIFEKAKNNKTAIKMMKGIRAGSTGIIICAVLKLFNVAIINGEYNYLSNNCICIIPKFFTFKQNKRIFLSNYSFD